MMFALISTPGLYSAGLTQVIQDLEAGVEVVQWLPDAVPTSIDGLHLIVLDLDVLGAKTTRGIQAFVRRLHSRTTAPIVAIAAELDRALMTTVRSAGARVFITKVFRSDELQGVLRMALDAGPVSPADVEARRRIGQLKSLRQSSSPRSKRCTSLTTTEMRVLALLPEGYSNRGIAKALAIGEGTVMVLVHSIYRKLGVQNRMQAMRKADSALARWTLTEHTDSWTDRLLPYMSGESRSQGEVLFSKGDVSEGLYYIVRGRITFSEINETVGDGELFGDIDIFAPERAVTCTARCDTDVKLRRLTREKARHLFIEEPQFAYHVMELMATRIGA